ncbi:MAG TPA: alkaline phosphatase family protein [Microthrixaceae bacterium]|nr:alkaline phosphatase family protein [Microthrixaceae bacterium]HMU81526.1 alkaline phosphatase family protein [Microthrixaceae bacterium]HMV75013.1 alkaline phosphatase family protein [Microthrixaceae bacterium]HMX07089.1 alkaline phosphatase family protein [Microthrixaceae bacterium]HMX65920.1 alkaline phosphatase family protein [Microthrixaceae bacterium]
MTSKEPAVVDLPVLPDYEGACTCNVMTPLVEDPDRVPAWFPDGVVGADQVVLWVLDGLGWEQMQDRIGMLRGLSSMNAAPITTIAPTTTATALTSIATGLPPGEHGVIGYRMSVEGDDILNVLRWTTSKGDARESIPPESIQHELAFEGHRPPAVVRAEFRDTGFTRAHLGGCRHVPYRMPSTLVAEILHQVHTGEPFVYAYYDGIDKVAHEYGLGMVYDAELVFVDRMVEYLLHELPPGVALVITSDHGQVDVGERVFPPHPEVLSHVRHQSGEARFRWLHAHPGAATSLYEAAQRHHGHEAWVVTREQVVDDCWFGPKVLPGALARLGDVALVAREPIAYEDPADTGPFHLLGRHGSMTSAEVMVPLLVARTD